MIDRIDVVEKLYNVRLAEVKQRKTDLIDLRVQEEQLASKDLDLKKVEAAIATLTNMVYGESVQSLAEVLNYGIRSAYPREVTAVVEKAIASGRPTLSIGLMDGGSDPIDPESAHGGGLAQILGFLARVIIILATGKRRLLILDETFSAVSGDLLPDLSALIRAIVEQLDFQVVLVTHKPELGDAAQRLYQLQAPGTLIEVETSYSL